MRRSKPISVGSLWEEMIAGNGRLAQRLTEARLPQIWSDVVGEPIASATSSVEFNNGILTVHIYSAVLRNEVFIRRLQLTEAINQMAKKHIVNYITVK
jgi:hypothetical protein